MDCKYSIIVSLTIMGVLLISLLLGCNAGDSTQSMTKPSKGTPSVTSTIPPKTSDTPPKTLNTRTFYAKKDGFQAGFSCQPSISNILDDTRTYSCMIGQRLLDLQVLRISVSAIADKPVVSDDYIKTFIDTYEENLSRTDIDFQHVTFRNFDALQYSVAVDIPEGFTPADVDSTDITQCICKQIIFVRGNKSYTLGVTALAAKADEYFETFLESFEFVTQENTVGTLKSMLDCGDSLTDPFVTYTDESGLFEISLPREWEISDPSGISADLQKTWQNIHNYGADGAITIFKAANVNEDCIPMVSINLNDTIGMKSLFDDLDSMISLAHISDKYTVIDFAKTAFQGRDTTILHWEADYFGTGKNHYLHMFTVSDDVLWTVVCTTKMGCFEYYEDIFNDILCSFKILKDSD